jgi:hypothetical protein
MRERRQSTRTGFFCVNGALVRIDELLAQSTYSAPVEG